MLFFGGLSLPVTQSLLSHLLSINMRCVPYLLLSFTGPIPEHPGITNHSTCSRPRSRSRIVSITVQLDHHRQVGRQVQLLPPGAAHLEAVLVSDRRVGDHHRESEFESPGITVGVRVPYLNLFRYCIVSHHETREL